jgi:hypothetical protein
MKYKFSKTKLLEDIIDTGKAAAYTTGCALSFLGLEYINQNVLQNPIQIPLPNNTPILSQEFGLYAAQLTCVLGTGIEGINTIYNAIKIPTKIITGKYFKKDYSKNHKNDINKNNE